MIIEEINQKIDSLIKSKDPKNKSLAIELMLNYGFDLDQIASILIHEDELVKEMKNLSPSVHVIHIETSYFFFDCMIKSESPGLGWSIDFLNHVTVPARNILFIEYVLIIVKLEVKGLINIHHLKSRLENEPDNNKA